MQSASIIMIVAIGVALVTCIIVFVYLYKIRKISISKDAEQCDNDIETLKLLLRYAIKSISDNIELIRGDKPLNLSPLVLLTKYPFYIHILRVPQYIESNACMDKSYISRALKELSQALHVNVAGYHNYYVLLDLDEAYEYYLKYKSAGIDYVL